MAVNAARVAATSLTLVAPLTPSTRLQATGARTKASAVTARSSQPAPGQRRPLRPTSQRRSRRWCGHRDGRRAAARTASTSWSRVRGVASSSQTEAVTSARWKAREPSRTTSSGPSLEGVDPRHATDQVRGDLVHPGVVDARMPTRLDLGLVGWRLRRRPADGPARPGGRRSRRTRGPTRRRSRGPAAGASASGSGTSRSDEDWAISSRMAVTVSSRTRPRRPEPRCSMTSRSRVPVGGVGRRPRSSGDSCSLWSGLSGSTMTDNGFGMGRHLTVPADRHGLVGQVGESLRQQPGGGGLAGCRRLRPAASTRPRSSARPPACRLMRSPIVATSAAMVSWVVSA